jgi:formate dehydrogenase major subunit
MAHVIVTEGLIDEASSPRAASRAGVREVARVHRAPRNSPEASAAVTGVPAEEVRAAARLYATGGNGRSTTGSA